MDTSADPASPAQVSPADAAAAAAAKKAHEKQVKRAGASFRRGTSHAALDYLGRDYSDEKTEYRCTCTALGCAAGENGETVILGRCYDRHPVTQVLWDRALAIDALLGVPPRKPRNGRHIHPIVSFEGKTEADLAVRQKKNKTQRNAAFLLPPVEEQCELAHACFLTDIEAEALVSDGRCHRHRTGDSPGPCNAFVDYRAMQQAALRAALSGGAALEHLPEFQTGYRWVTELPPPPPPAVAPLPADDAAHDELTPQPSAPAFVTPAARPASRPASPSEDIKPRPAQRRRLSPDVAADLARDTADEVAASAEDAERARARQAAFDRDEEAICQAHLDACERALAGHLAAEGTAAARSKMLADVLVEALGKRDDKLADLKRRHASWADRAEGEGPPKVDGQE